MQYSDQQLRKLVRGRLFSDRRTLRRRPLVIRGQTDDSVWQTFNENRRHIVQLCVRLSGGPLAVSSFTYALTYLFHAQVRLDGPREKRV
jgi:hypothetical protein